MADNNRVLFNRLHSLGYTDEQTGSFEEFNEAMGDENKRKSIFDNVTRNGDADAAGLGTYTEYETKYGAPSNEGYQSMREAAGVSKNDKPVQNKDYYSNLIKQSLNDWNNGEYTQEESNTIRDYRKKNPNAWGTSNATILSDYYGQKEREQEKREEKNKLTGLAKAVNEAGVYGEENGGTRTLQEAEVAEGLRRKPTTEEGVTYETPEKEKMESLPTGSFLSAEDATKQNGEEELSGKGSGIPTDKEIERQFFDFGKTQDGKLAMQKGSDEYFSMGGDNDKPKTVTRTNPETGEEESVFLTPWGITTDDESFAQALTDEYNERTEEAAKAYQEYCEGLDKQIATARQWTADKRKELRPEGNSYGAKYQGRNSYWSRCLRYTNSALQRAEDIRNAALRNKSDEGNAAWKWTKEAGIGLADEATRDPSLYTYGAYNADMQATVNRIKEKQEKGEKLKDYEEKLLEALAIEAAANSYYGADTNAGYRAGQMTAYSLPFIAQMIVTKGVFGGVGPFSNATGWGVLANDLVALAPLQELTVSLPNVVGDAYDRMNGQATFEQTPDGGVRYTGHVGGEESMVKAIGKSVVSNWAENATEYLGDSPVFDYIGKGFGSLSKRLGFGNELNIGNAIGNKGFAKGITQFQRYAEWSGFWGELGEEEVNNLIDVAIGDMTFDDGENGIFNPETHIEIANGLAPMSLFFPITKTLGYGHYQYVLNKQVNNLIERGDALWQNRPKEWGNLKKAVRDGDVEGVKKMLSGIVTDRNLSRDQRAVANAYALNGLALNGALGEEEELIDSSKMGEVEQSLRDAYGRGMEREDGDDKPAMNEMMANITALGEAVKGAVGEDLFTQLRDNPVRTLYDARMSGKFGEEVLEKMREYAEAKAEFEGVAQGFMMNAQNAMSAANDDVDMRTNQADGMVHPAILKNNENVSIISGGVEADENGHPVKTGEDSLIIVIGEDGRKRAVNIADIMIVGTPASAEMLKRMRMDEIKEQTERDFVSRMNGEVSLADGSVVTILDNEGNPQTIRVLGQAADEQGTPLEGMLTVEMEDGTPVQLSADYIQQQARYATQKAAADAVTRSIEGNREDAGEETHKAGDKVSFSDDNGNVIEGTIVEYNADDDTWIIRDANGEEWEATEDELVKADETNETLPPRTYTPGDRVRLSLDGDGVVDGVVTQVRPGSVVVVQWQQPDGRVNQSGFDANQLNEMENQVRERDEEQGTAESEQVPVTEEISTTGQEQPQESALSQIPVDEQGNPDFEKAQSPAQAVDAAIEMTGGDMEKAMQGAEMSLAQAQDALKTALETKAEPGANFAENIANINAKEEATKQAQQKVDFWQGVVDEFNRRQEAANAPAEETQTAQEAPVEQETRQTEEKKSSEGLEALTQAAKERQKSQKVQERERKKKREMIEKASKGLEETLTKLNVPHVVCRSAAEMVEAFRRLTGRTMTMDEADRSNAFVAKVNGRDMAFFNVAAISRNRTLEETRQRGRELTAHEIFAHYGLPVMMGQEGYDRFCGQVYDSMSEDAREEYNAYYFDYNLNRAAHRRILNGLHLPEHTTWSRLSEEDKEKVLAELGTRMTNGAADEYIAHLAEKVERGEVLTDEEKTLWQKIVDAVRKLLGFETEDTTFGDKDIARAILASKKNLEERVRSNETEEIENAPESEEERVQQDTRKSAEEAREEKKGEKVGENGEKDVSLQEKGENKPRYKGWEKRSVEINTSDYEPTDEFRGLQESSRRRGEEAIRASWSAEHIDRDTRERLAGIFRQQLESGGSANGRSDGILGVEGEPDTQYTIRKNVSGKLFHDIFEIVRSYLPNGELVDLHDNYDDCICYLSEDGTSGFAINKETGYRTSIFNLGVRRKFLRSTSDYIREQGGTHGDCYNSSRQPLPEIYEKAWGAKVVATMDYNMEYDHDDIAKNHGNPEIVFMCLPEKGSDMDIKVRHFGKDEYEQAEAYANSFNLENPPESRFSREEAENILTGMKSQKQAGVDYGQADVDGEMEDIRNSVGRRRREVMENRLRKNRPDVTQEQSKALFDYLDTLNNTKLENATFDWFLKGSIRIPEDMEKVRQAVRVADAKHIDIQNAAKSYDGPQAFLDANADFKIKGERINPDDVPELHKVQEYPGGIVVYDFYDGDAPYDGDRWYELDAEDEEQLGRTRKALREIINTHWGEDANPWCLLQGDGEGNLTEDSATYWDRYSRYGKRVAFKDGKLLAFFASDGEPTWWDRQDRPHRGVPVAVKLEDGSGRSATYEYVEPMESFEDRYPYSEPDVGSEDRAMWEEDNGWQKDYTPGQTKPTDIHRGNPDEGIYEQWYDNGQIKSRWMKKDGAYDGVVETWYENGKPHSRATYKDGKREGVSESWYMSGKPRERVEYKDGRKDGEFVRYHENGKPEEVRNYKRDKLDGLCERFAPDGSILHREECRNDHRDGVEEEWDPRAGYLTSRREWKEGVMQNAEYYDGRGRVTRREYNEGSHRVADTFWGNGRLWSRERLWDGKYDGAQEEWDENGVPLLYKNYKDGRYDGPQFEFGEDGSLERTLLYENGLIKEEIPLDEAERLWEEAKSKMESVVPPEAGEGDMKFSMSEEERKEIKAYLKSKDYASVLTGEEFPKGEKSLMEQVTDFYKERYGGRVFREGVGEVILDKEGVRSSIAHGLRGKKVAAFAAVPGIITKGRVIDTQANWKGRDYGSTTIAAPIKIGKGRYIGTVVLTRGENAENFRFYLHKVNSRKDLLDESSTTAFEADTHQGGIAKLLRNILSPTKSEEKVSENEEKSSEGHYRTREEKEIVSKAREDGTLGKAPNGKESELFKNHGERVWAMVRTPQFKNWFGDWEKGENSSKVIDGNGEPLVVYHGTVSDEETKKWDGKSRDWTVTHTPFTVFRRNANGEGNAGFWFSSNADVAGSMGFNFYETFLNARNPLVVDCNRSTYADIPFDGKRWDGFDLASYAEKNGYDGLILRNISDGADLGAMDIHADDYVVFKSDQVKSVENNGEFSTSNNDIRFSTREAEEERRRAGEMAVDALRRKGVEVVTDAEEMQRVLDEARRKGKGGQQMLFAGEKELGVRFLKTPDGEVLGFVHEGKVYIDPATLDANTPVHEYTHLWDTALRKSDPKLWQEGIELMKQTPLWEQVKNDPHYKDIAGDENLLASEVHSRLTGEEGRKYFEQLAKEADEAKGPFEKAEKISLMEQLRRWIDKVLKWAKEKLFGKPEMTVEEFRDMPLKDLLESNAEQGGVDEKMYREGVRFSVVDKEEGKSLVGVHNISEEKFRKALKLGGLANPSVAVIDAGKFNHDGFGEISLITPPELIDSKTGRNAGTWLGDAWTPSFPETTRHLSEESRQRMEADVERLPKFMQEGMRRSLDAWADGNENSVQVQDMLSYLYLNDKGIAPKVNTSREPYSIAREARDYVTKNEMEQDFHNWLNSLNERYAAKEVIFGGFTPSGNRKYIPATLENVSRWMNRQGQNGSMSGWGGGNITASVLPRVGRLDEIRRNKDRLSEGKQGVLDFDIKKWGPVLYEIERSLENKGGISDGEAVLEDAMGKPNPQAYLRSEYGIELTENESKKINDFIKAVQEERPAMYFETKFNRPVQLNEFAGAVVPEGTSEDIIKALNDAGLKVETYEKGSLEDRKRAVNELATEDVRFSREDEPSFMSEEKGERQKNKSGGLLDAVRTLYERGKAAASKLYSRTYFDVAKTPDFMKGLGLTGDRFTIRYGVISRHMDKDGAHEIPVEVWEQLPEALQRPFAITEYYGSGEDKASGKNKGYRLYTAIKHGDGYIVVGAEVKNAGRDVEVNSISTVFGRDGKGDLEDVIYRSKEITPEQSSLLDGPNSHQYPTEQEFSGGKVTTNPETAKENGENSGDLRFSTREAEEAGERAQQIVDEAEERIEAKRREEQQERANEVARGFGLDGVALPKNAENAEGAAVREAARQGTLKDSLGERWDEFLKKVYQNTDEETLKDINEFARQNGWNFAEATERYLASLSDNGAFERAVERGVWDNIKSAFNGALEGKGIEDGVSDNDARYALWRNEQNKTERADGTILARATDVAMNNEMASEDDGGDGADTRYSRGDNEPVRIRDTYERRMYNGWFQTKEAMQDSMRSLWEFEKMVLGDEWKGIDEIPDYMNAYFGENRLSSVNEAEMRAMSRLLFNPLYAEVRTLAGDAEERKTLNNYMMAKHGLERNLYMAERNAKADYERRRKDSDAPMPEWDDLSDTAREQLIDRYRRDYAGLTALAGLESDNLAQAEQWATDLVDSYERAHDTGNLWDKVRTVNDAILTKELETGLIDKPTYDKIKGMYRYYIPLRGFDETTTDEMYAYIDQQARTFNNPLKVARGRTSVADDPFANMEQMAESAVMHGNRNQLVKQTFYNFVMAHPSDLVSVNQLWLEKLPDGTWQAKFCDTLRDGDTPEQVTAKLAKFEEDMQKAAQDHPDMYKTGSQATDIPYKMPDLRNINEHQVVVKVDGKDIVLTVNGNPRLAQAINGKTNPDAVQRGAIGKFVEGLGVANRALSSIYTTWNPDFIMSNFFRDMIYTNSIVWVKESPAYARAFHANCLKCNPIQMKMLLARQRNGQLDMNNEMDRLFDEFIRNGGETGYARMSDIEDIKKKLAKELKKKSASLDGLAEVAGELGRAVEMAARFAAYVTSRQAGREMGRSIWDAKEISVNFNKKGAGDRFLGETGQTWLGNTAAAVSGAGRGLYVFWNASVQGLTNIGRAAGKSPQKAIGVAGTLFALGLLNSLLGNGGGDGDDDGERGGYWDIPDYIRRNNFVFRGPGKTWFRIPLPIEFRAVYGMAEILGGMYSGHVDMEQGLLDMVGQFTQVLPLDMLEGQEPDNWDFWQSVMPSSVKPIYEIANNRSWTGMPIYSQGEYNQEMPEWTKAFSNTSPVLVNMAAQLNEWTGGDDYTKGKIDINPATWQYFLRQYGPFYTMWNELVNTGATVLGQKDFDWRNVPLMNRIVMNDNASHERGGNREYWTWKKKADETRRRVNKYEKDLKYTDKFVRLVNSPEYGRAVVFGGYESAIRALNEVINDPNVSDEQKKQFKEQRSRVQKEAVNEMRSMAGK